jgi:hypothetical protein
MGTPKIKSQNRINNQKCTIKTEWKKEEEKIQQP